MSFATMFKKLFQFDPSTFSFLRRTHIFSYKVLTVLDLGTLSKTREIVEFVVFKKLAQ